jgi:putative PIG3 family NAD(P)H quinone oxidoreductase
VPPTHRAVVASGPGGPEVLSVGDVADVAPGPGEVAIAVAATAINRADLLQRRGHYQPPPGASDVLGMECSGTVAELGEGVSGWRVGDECCALLAGGGYAERVVAPAGQLMPLPDGVALADAAALPEVACTVWSNVFMIAGLRQDEWFLVHGGAGGIGSFAIQLTAALGARVMATAGSEAKLARCADLGAEVTIDYRRQDFVAEVMGASDGHGADVVLDNMGAKYLGRNVDALATEGRLVIIGLQGGTRAELDIARLMAKEGAVIGTLLRPRPVDRKAAICAAVVQHVWPLVADGTIRPVIGATMPLAEAGPAHALMESGDSYGKILLTVD